MTKKLLWILLACLTLTGLIWFLTPVSRPIWIKHVVLFGASLYQLIIFFYLTKLPIQDKKERYFGLTEKIYSMTIMAAMTIYSVGIWILTPSTQPTQIKPLFLGTGLTALLGLLLYNTFKKIDEGPDDHFYANLAKTACFTLILILLSFLALGLISFFFPFTLTTGVILFFSAVTILVFDMVFFFFEKRGD